MVTFRRLDRSPHSKELKDKSIGGSRSGWNKGKMERNRSKRGVWESGITQESEL